MPKPEGEGQSWPPAPMGQTQPLRATVPRLPRGLKVGMVAAALGVVFTLWQFVRLTPGRYPLFRSLPDNADPHAFYSSLGGYWLIFLSLPMLTALVFAGAGLAVCIWDWRVCRRAGQHESFGMTALGVALNLLPFILFVGLFIKRVGFLSR